MTRLDSAATVARALRAVAGIGAVFVLSVAASGCVGGGAAPSATPDPFAGLADRSDQAFREGLELYGQGQYRDALTAFERARILSPSADTRIDQMIERSRTALAPTATPVPPTPTAVPAAPTATPLAMSKLAPDAELGRRYFGQVSLAVVPTREMDSPAATQFFFQDQIGLRIEGLKTYARLPYSLRVFNMDTNQLVAEVQDDAAAAVANAARAGATAGVPTGLAANPDAAAQLKAFLASGSNKPADAGTTAATAGAAAASKPADDIKLTHFWETYVWYHQGGETPGRYRVELYATGLLTNTFEYTISNVPVPTPEPTLAPATAEPTLAPQIVPTEVPAPAAPPAPPARSTTAQQVAPVAAAPASPTATPQPTVVPSPTPMPTPATAAATIVGGLPAGVDVDPTTGRVFIADGSGVLWATDPGRSTFNRPITLGNLPVDLAIDQTTGYVFVSARNESAVVVLDASGRRLTSIPMPVPPGDLQVDSQLGLVYVVLPERQALGVIDGRAGRLLRTVNNLPQITSLALDSDRHVLYASHLAGQLSVIDVASSQVTARITLTGVGLQGVATARGLAYGINSATHELAVVEPISQGVIRYPLAVEPAAITASEGSGSIYVLSSRPNVILRLDPTAGLEVGRVALPDRSGRFGVQVNAQSDFLGQRSRMVLNHNDETLYITLPEAGSLSVIPNDLFPSMDHDIPWVETPSTPLIAAIPGVMRPGAPALPDQPSPYAQAAQAAPTPADEEAN